MKKTILFMISVMLASATAMAQRTVTGNVSDETGPLPRASGFNLWIKMKPS